jgi:hypothetical protein
MKLFCHRGAAHEYRDEEQGVDLFSVSQIRKVAHDPYIGIPVDVLEAARMRGTLLHRRFWKVLAAQDGLMEMPAPITGLEGYCAAMDSWVVRNQVKPVRLEEPSASLKFGYAGTPDALVLYGKSQLAVLPDLKTGAPTKTDPMQLIAYQKMHGYEGATKLLDLYVQADGTFKEVWVSKSTQAVEWAWFLSALGVLQSRVNHNCR